ncbi:succinate dehydrogenase [Desulfotomaculum copahuensis]|uniref:Succinate dehydrogenase n=1 Tax=Desulfotomaculum copahuensis TaxID=1838280 RepID=A0A1B7LHB6_9FIRM|nr:succinate dehydrogenase [Desulfotomaculum copahuensis]OAT85586.1 succinate dehydrogenase [Desulfotomaculum copahuensis]
MATQQKLLTRNPRADMLVDLLELFSGLFLVGFLWTHMFFVGVIYFGANIFDRFSIFLDKYYLSYIGIAAVILVFLTHLVVAGRRIPNRYREQKIVWRHARMIGHTDTWIWVFQTITGMAILILGSIHVWAVTSGWPIRAMISAGRMTHFLWFYALLLIISEYHAGFGLYRQFVKWGWFNRHSVGAVLKTISVIIVLIGVGIMWVLLRLGGAR